MKRSNVLKGYIFVILSAIIFGLMPLMAKLIYAEGTNPQSLVLLRNALSVPFLLIFSVLTKGFTKIRARVFPQISFIALMGCCLTPLLLFNSYNHIPSGTATVFHFIYPAVVVLGEYIIFNNKLSFGHILSVIFCAVGIMLFYNKNSIITFEGSFYALLSGVTYAIYVMCLSSFKHKEISGFTFNLCAALFSTVVMLAVCLLTNQLKLPQSVYGWFLTLLFSLSLNVGAIVLFQKGTFLIGGGRASVLSTLEPVTSILAGAIVFNENINAHTYLGTILVVVASVLIALNDMKSESNL